MKLQKGLNLGGFLSQCDHEISHYETFIQKEDIDKIAGWGFDHVRLPIDYEVVEEEDGREKESGYAYIDNVISWCESNHLNIILDIHKVAGYDFNNANDAAKNSLFQDEALQQRFMTLWRRMANRYSKCSNVAFELLNEVVETENASAWNRLIKRVVSVIREEAPTSLIIYGGIEWNGAKHIPELEDPIDENIMFTFHYYEPLLFTHQKAYWVPTMDPDETVHYTDDMEWFREHSVKIGQQGHPVVDAKASKMNMEFHEEMIEDALKHCKEHGIKLYCGEFGVIDRAPVEDALKWFKDVTSLFHKYSIGYAVWNYKEKDFGISGAIYDPIRKELMEALQ